MNAKTAFLALLMLVLASCSWAQSGNEGSLEGIVMDSSGAVLPGVSVKLRQQERAASFAATSDATGLFRFAVLPVGTYELTAERAGFDPLVQKNLAVTVGARISLTLNLQVSGRSEFIKVTGETPLVETTRSQVSATVTSREISSLPVNGRNFTDFALLTPGVTRDHFGGLSFAGQRKLNSILVDGADNNDPHFDEALAGTGFASRPPYQLSLEAVEGFQVNSNAYSAELGRAGGGVINTVTKSGTNEFHGSGFWFYRDKALNANDLVNKINSAPKSPYHFHQLGGTLGGPLRKDRWFFFLNYDGQRSRQQAPVRMNLPASFRLSPDATVAAFQQRALDFLATRTGLQTRTFDQNVSFGKLDWQAARNHHLTASWNRQRFTGEGLQGVTVTTGAQVSSEHFGTLLEDTDTAGVLLTSTFSSSVIHVARFNLVRSAETGKAGSVNPEANVFEGGQLALSLGRDPMAPRQVAFWLGQYSDVVTYARGRHLYKFGADVLLLREAFFNSTNFSGSYRFRSLESFGRSLAGTPAPLAGDENYLQAFSGTGTPGTTSHPDSTEYAGFLQDEWRMRAGLTLNFGLRYDLQVIAEPGTRNPAAALAAAGLDTGFLRTDTNNLAPRLGLAWAPLRSNRLVVRLGYGIFYGFTPGLLTSRAQFQNGITVQTRTLSADTPGAKFIPAYPNTLCGPPDSSGAPPSCAAPAAGLTPPILMLFSRAYTQPYVQQGSLGVEYRLAEQWSLAANYLVARGTHLQRVRDINLAVPKTPATVPSAGTGTLLTYGKFTGPRPSAGFDRILQMESDANSIYHGVTLQVTKRFARRWELLGSYTFSKVIDDVPDASAINPGTGDGRMLSDPSDARADRAPGVNDQRHRFVLSGNWQLGGAEGLTRASKALMAGWELSGILTAQSGQPYSGLVSFDLNNDGNSATDRTPGLGRNTFPFPATAALDLRITRNVRLTESAKVQFIWEGFNVLNRANITGVRTTQYAYSTSSLACGAAGAPCLLPQNTGLSAFGTPTATSGPRILQLSAKFIF